MYYSYFIFQRESYKKNIMLRRKHIFLVSRIWFTLASFIHCFSVWWCRTIRYLILHHLDYHSTIAKKNSQRAIILEKQWVVAREWIHKLIQWKQERAVWDDDDIIIWRNGWNKWMIQDWNEWMTESFLPPRKFHFPRVIFHFLSLFFFVFPQEFPLLGFHHTRKIKIINSEDWLESDELIVVFAPSFLISLPEWRNKKTQ